MKIFGSPPSKKTFVKYAKGTGVTSAGASGYYDANNNIAYPDYANAIVSGLGFVPKKIYINLTSPTTNNTLTTVYDNDLDFKGCYGGSYVCRIMINVMKAGGSTFMPVQVKSPAQINNGFTLPCGGFTSTNFTWYATE